MTRPGRARAGGRSGARAAARALVGVLLLLGPGNAAAGPGARRTAPAHIDDATSRVDRTQWVMGTTLKIWLPADRADLDALFTACFEEARRWDARLSPWKEAAPLSQLSRSSGEWVEMPIELIDYLERARRDARRTDGVFDITLRRGGSREIELDREASRARLADGPRALDPGADGKGVALDAISILLDAARVEQYLLDFGGSSFVARGRGPGDEPWTVSLTDAAGVERGRLRLADTALSVSSTVQREELEDGRVRERFHLLDLETGEAVEVRRSAAVLSPSATEAEVLSTVLAIRGPAALESALLDRFSPCALAFFTPEAAPVYRGGFEEGFDPVARRPPR